MSIFNFEIWTLRLYIKFRINFVQLNIYILVRLKNISLAVKSIEKSDNFLI